MPTEMVHPINVEKGQPSYSSRLNVTTRATTVAVGEGLELNPRYFASTPGILKIVQLVRMNHLCLCLCSFSCYVCSFCCCYFLNVTVKTLTELLY